MIRFLQIGAILVGILICTGLYWVSAKAAEYNEIDCERQTVRKELKTLGFELTDEINPGDARTVLISKATYLDFYCRTICSDGRTGEHCVPSADETTTSHCRLSRHGEICRHALFVSGSYVDDQLIGDPKTKVLTWKRGFLETLFSREDAT